MANLIFIFVLFLLGLLMLLNPRLLWAIESVLTMKEGEPTETYLSLMRIGGVGFMIAAIAKLFGLF